jgi:hypothetical protein
LARRMSALKKLGWPSRAAEHSATASLNLQVGAAGGGQECGRLRS